MNIYTSEQVEKVKEKIADIFNTAQVEYYRKNPFQEGKFQYFANVEEIYPEIQANWSRTFHNGSYYSISKSTDLESLRLGFEITYADLIEVCKN